ncbi:MAG TPA: signal peptidase I, partial [Armatimonadota bacterium]
MTTLSERLANVSIPTVIAAVIVLFIVRYLLMKRKSEFAKSAAEVTESVLIAVVLVFLIIRPFILQAFFIPSESMVPTLEISDHILVNKFLYRFEQPRRGDIVVFKSPASAHADEKDFITRLIGLPGDKITVKIDGRDFDGTPYGTLYVNGKRFDEPYLNEPHHIRCQFSALIDLQKTYTVPDGKYLMMGYNRNNSNDSRFWGVL